ncbi:MAG: hypothetical protein MRJ96_01015 [Nitrospirales bacterium]|nr:hypothetical protein [Nitrospira sp.]MDR4500022.1 hypothetical protein [Nitrospirales bacterium]
MRCQTITGFWVLGLLTLVMQAEVDANVTHADVNHADVNHADVSKVSLQRREQSVQLGPRPSYLVEKMERGKLKRELKQCLKRQSFRRSDFSISHRGAPMQFPEHTQESYEAAHRMGAGIQECDVTFTKDGELVCRHAQCDLHTTTDVVAREDLRHQCKVPPEFDAQGRLTNAAAITCCASDFTLEQFQSLKGKMDAANTVATTVAGYLGGTADYRTDLYATGGTLLSHKASIALFERMGVKFTPELKEGNEEDIIAIFGSQENYALKMIDEYWEAGIHPDRVFAQSFNLDDVLTWIKKRPRYGEQAVFLDGGPIPRPDPGPFLKNLTDRGVKIVAPPMPMLLRVNQQGEIEPSQYAEEAKAHGLKIITWTTERSGRIVEDVLRGGGTFYYQTILDALTNDGDILRTIDVLAQKVGVLGIFSDWPATTTFYANCKNLGIHHTHSRPWRQTEFLNY